MSPGPTSALDEPPASRVREVLALAWPAVLSYLLNNAYRINDQFWIQGLGPEAQAAIGASFFVQVMNFALVFLALGGTLALVSRATGARDPGRLESVVRHAVLFGLGIGVTITALGLPLVGPIVGVLDLRGAVAVHGADYLSVIYAFTIPLALFPIVDAIFIGLGNTRVPMALQLSAVALNYCLNPMLIYGAEAGRAMDAPGAELLGRLAGVLGIEGHGAGGAALATGIARLTTVSIALAILRWGYGIRPLGRFRPRAARFLELARIGAPVSVSIAVYAAAYWMLLGLVLDELGSASVAGLGLGLQVFEGVAFPCYLGFSIAGSALVGRAIGERDPAGALEVVRSVRLLARVAGLSFAGLFLLGGRPIAACFTQDPDVLDQTVLYVRVLAFSQYWVAVEAVNERVLLGAGQTRPILWISPLGNLLRVPLGWLLALPLALGAAGVWVAIDLSTLLKAWLYWRRVRRGDWLARALHEEERLASRASAVAPEAVAGAGP